MADDAFRWQSFFQRCSEPVFLLNRRRSILFVNRAWEALTGVPLPEARGLVCRRRREPLPDSPELLQQALAPPPEALAGKTTCVRRLILGGAGPRWWDVTFFPFHDSSGLLGILGRITPVATEGVSPTPLLPERLVALRQGFRQGFGLESLASEQPAMRRVAEQVRLASRTPSPVLIVGEPGAGKEWAARTIHQESPGRELAFAALDCGKLPAGALESALFGPLRLSRAGVGTLYLKEPQRLPRELQARVLDLAASAGSDRTAGSAPGLRLIAGCDADPAQEVATGRLLAELHFTLSTLTIVVPPLRERLADLPLLIERMLDRLRADGEPVIKGVSAEALDVLRGHLWPGNLQDLHTVLAQACAQARGERIEVSELPWYLRNPAPPAERNLPLDTLLEQVERRLILLALRKARNNKTRAAEILAIWRPRLLRRMQALGIEVERKESEGGEPGA